MIPVHYHVHPAHPLREAFTRMRSDGVDVLPVIDADEVVGLLTLADVRGDSTAWEVDVDRAAVRDVMTAAFTWGFEDDALDRAMSVLRASGQRRLPIVNRRHELVGMLVADAAGKSAGGGAGGRIYGTSTGSRATGNTSGDPGGERGRAACRERVGQYV